MTILADTAVIALLLLRAGFVLIGSWGLVRLPSKMERQHGPTAATTLGLGALLLASVIYFQARLGVWTTHELLISLLLFITAPISAHRRRAAAAERGERLGGLRGAHAGHAGRHGRHVRRWRETRFAAATMPRGRKQPVAIAWPRPACRSQRGR